MRVWRGVAASLTALALAVAVLPPVSASAESMWFPVATATTTGQVVQVAVQPVVGYSGGSVAGQSTSWLQIPESLIAAMDAEVGQTFTPVGWQVQGAAPGTYLQVVGVEYGGTKFMASGATGSYTWDSANAWSGNGGGAILYPSTSGSTTGIQYAATGDVLPAASGSTTTVQCGKTVLQFNGAGEVATQAQGIYADGTKPNAPVEQFNIYNSDGSVLQAMTPPKDTCNSGKLDSDWLQQFGGNAIPVLGSGGKLIYPVDCQAPNLIVNGMCVLQSSLPANETVTQAVYGLLQSYYGSISNCATVVGADGQGGCGTWFTWQATDPVTGPSSGQMIQTPQPPGTYPCASLNGAELYCVTKPNP